MNIRIQLGTACIDAHSVPSLVAQFYQTLDLANVVFASLQYEALCMHMMKLLTWTGSDTRLLASIVHTRVLCMRARVCFVFVFPDRFWQTVGSKTVLIHSRAVCCVFQVMSVNVVEEMCLSCLL